MGEPAVLSANDIASENAGCYGYSSLAEANSAWAERFRAALLDPASRLGDPGLASKGCLPQYGVAVRFQKGRDRLDCFLCYDCSIVVFDLNGKPVGYGNFDFVATELRTLAREIFPRDKEIQALR